MKVGFVGLGSMGGAQARLLARAGHDLAVFDAYEPALEAFRGKARLANSPADAAAGAEAVGICVRDDRQIEDAVFGPQGLAETMAAGTLLLVHSTISVETIQALHERLSPKGVSVMDATVTRTSQNLDEPYVATMLGGDAAEVERARAVVSAYSTDIIHAGPLGAGLALKIANNLVTWVQIVIGVHARDLAARHGVSYDTLRTAMTANGNLTPIMRAMLDAQERTPPGANAERDVFADSQAGNGEKDLSIAARRLAATGLDPSVAEATQKVVRAAMIEMA